jgi:mRNA-degrading endonuclease RelE of RelBE toxin-antitoxin system
MTRMTRRPAPPRSSRYRLHITSAALRELKQLPGHVRQRARHAISQLAIDPRPATSRILEQETTPHEARRLRLGRWRILYVIDEVWLEIAVVAVRQRPPYQYQDLVDLLTGSEDD